jgi:hypothetical protein
MNNFQIKDKLLQIGLTEEECASFSEYEQFQYLRFYTKKNWQKISITFIGFSDSESDSLLTKVDNESLKVYKNLSKSLNFICLSESVSEKQIEKVKKCGVTVLPTNIFLKLFQFKYELIDNETLYNLNVSKAFKIAKPLSNFNENINVESFSENNENYYSANLYTMKCSCGEFSSRHKSMYPLGDLRRLCKHLILLYKNNFGVYQVSPFAKGVFEDGYGLASKFRQIRVDEIDDAIVINFEQELGWWNLYVPNKQGDYIKYGYSPTEKRFSHNRKPIGIIPQLRIKLDALENEFSSSVNKKHTNTTSDESSNGCLSVIVVFVFLGFLLYILH